MNDNDFDRTARAWLDDGPTRMSDRALLSALEDIHTTRQRRVVWPARRAAPVSMFARMAVAAVLVIGVGLLAVNVLPRQPDRSSVGRPADRTVARPSRPFRVIDFPNLTTTFVSLRNGFVLKHPDRVALTPATNILGFGDDGFDVVETGSAAVFKGASTELPDMENGFLAGSRIPIDEWVDDLREDNGGCSVPRSQHAELIIDGQTGRISECSNQVEATVIAGGRLYLFTLLHDRGNAREVFDAFAATIDLTPETAIDFPNLPSTFVSPTYGYAFNYLDRGGLEPATRRWDPVNAPPTSEEGEGLLGRDIDALDVVETGMAAMFGGASMEIADEASIDDWIDDYLTAGGCYVPRSQQAEITIDGRSGRISDECPDKVVATVVADGRLYLFVLWHNRA